MESKYRDSIGFGHKNPFHFSHSIIKLPRRSIVFFAYFHIL